MRPRGCADRHVGYVRDRWTQPGQNGRRVRTERWGRGRRWQAVWTEAGVRRASTFASKDAALQHLALVETGQVGVHRQAVASMTFAEAWERWRQAQLHHKPSTRATVTQTGDKMILPILADRPIGDLTRADLQDLVTGWASNGYAPSRIRVAWSFVTGPLKLAVLDGILTTSPAVGVKLPARTRQRVVPLTVEQVETIAGRVPPWFRAMVILGAATGLRSGELRGLTWDRLVDGTVVVDRQLIDVDPNGRPVFGPPKSAASHRSVQLGAVAEHALAEHRERWPELEHGLVFYSRYRRPIGRSTANDAWRVAVEGLGARARSGWHDLRHFHASLLIAAGLSVRAVADRLGHDDPAETLQTYSHLWPTDQGRAVQACDALLGPVFGRPE